MLFFLNFLYCRENLYDISLAQIRHFVLSLTQEGRRYSVKKWSIFFILLIVCFVTINGVKAATREELLNYFPEEFLDAIPEERYQKLLTLDVSRAKKQEIEHKDTRYPEEISPLDQTHETSAKNLSIVVIPYSGSNTDYSITLTAKWKKMPTTKSYDVIAMRLDKFALAPGTALGYQISDGGDVSYGYLGTNMVYKSNGFGISMNIVDSTKSVLQCVIDADAAIDGSKHGTVYGAYEHALVNVSLAQSKNYNISAAGMGKVINFVDSVWQKYDDMDGVSMSY